MCEPSWKVGLLGTMFFTGWCATLLWVPRLADVYGRKKLFLIGMALNLVLLVAMLITSDLQVMTVIAFLFGCACPMRRDIGYVYMIEMMP